MNSCLAIFCAALVGFMGVLSYFDVSPKAFLYKSLRRFLKPPERLRPVTRDAPYRRIRNITTELHKPVLLNLETSDGSGQACHPDVVHVPGGFGSGRWPYWMVCTPHPYENEYVENPEIFASHDGITWSIPAGLKNPVVAPPEIKGDHHSDPDMIHREGELWLFYRKTLRSQTPKQNILYLTKSKDGVSWSESLEILRDDTGREFLSPAVVYDGRRFVMWTIEIETDGFKLMRRTSGHGVQWSDPERGTVLGLDASRHLWHIDVVIESDRLSAILISSTGEGGGGSRMHYAYSQDGGLNWRMSDFLFEQVYEFEAQRQYRGSLRRLEESDLNYELWYSASNRTNMFSIAYLCFCRPDDTAIAARRTAGS
jgi:hypothetical protein